MHSFGYNAGSYTNVLGALFACDDAYHEHTQKTSRTQDRSGALMFMKSPDVALQILVVGKLLATFLTLVLLQL